MPPNGARPKWLRHGLLLLSIVEPRSPATGATANMGGSGVTRRGEYQPRFLHSADGVLGTPTQIVFKKDRGFAGRGEQLLRAETQFDPDSYADVRPGDINPDCPGKISGWTWWTGPDLVPRGGVIGHSSTSAIG